MWLRRNTNERLGNDTKAPLSSAVSQHCSHISYCEQCNDVKMLDLCGRIIIHCFLLKADDKDISRVVMAE